MLDISQRAALTGSERRSFTVTDLEVRDGAEGPSFEGVASVVDTPYEVRDMFGTYAETITAGAFNKTLKEKADVRLLVNHDGVPLARTKSKTLNLAADPHLRAVAPSLDPSNPTVQEIRSAMERGDVDQMSIGFQVVRQDWNKDYTERTIREVKLFDVSIVTFPASPTTSAAIRSLDEFMSTLVAGQVDEDEIRRAIAHLETLLPTPEVVERTEDPDALYERLTALWAMRAA